MVTRFTVANLKYDDLAADSEVAEAFAGAVQQQVAAAAGVAEDRVEVELASGSVAVTATIYVDHGDKAAELASSIEVAAPQLSQSIMGDLQGIGAVRQLASGDLVVSGLAAEVSTPSSTASDAATGTPTPRPTSRPGAQQVKASGDPHMTNIHGERFDLMAQGNHLLIQIPRRHKRARWRRSQPPLLLQVDADAQRFGGSCEEMYIQELNVTGRWASDRLRDLGLLSTSGFRYQAEAPVAPSWGTSWQQLGAVGLKVTWGHTPGGVAYLNVFARHLSKAGVPVGGLLGEDDHTAAATSPPDCRRVVSVLQEPAEAMVGSTAVASL